MTDSLALVREFHETFGHPVSDTLTHPSEDIMNLRLDLIEEEFTELIEAATTNDIVGVADALGDLKYVIDGMALVYGIDLNAVTDEVHRSNMSKLGADGKPIYREDGKVLKGPNYFPPAIAAVIGL